MFFVLPTTDNIIISGYDLHRMETAPNRPYTLSGGSFLLIILYETVSHAQRRTLPHIHPVR